MLLSKLSCKYWTKYLIKNTKIKTFFFVLYTLTILVYSICKQIQTVFVFDENGYFSSKSKTVTACKKISVKNLTWLFVAHRNQMKRNLRLSGLEVVVGIPPQPRLKSFIYDKKPRFYWSLWFICIDSIGIST